jgi:tetratricopeptide (TPR) repeat protein
MASGHDVETANHAFELLDYAQNMDPSLDLVHAYRGAIHQALQQPQQAKDALDRALELNPYCELAIELMDRL